MARGSENVYGSEGSVPNSVPVQGSGAGPMAVRASPEDFGSQVGQGIEKVGNEGEQLAQHFSEIYADSTARDIVTQKSQQLANLENQFKQNRGNNAVTALPIFQQQANALIGDGLDKQSLIVQKMVKDDFAREVNGAIFRSGGYTADQAEKAQVSSFQSSIATKAALGAQHINDPISRANTVSGIASDSYGLAHTQGLDADSADQYMQHQVGEFYQSGIRQLMTTNPQAAKDVFNEAINGNYTANRDGKQVQIPYIDAPHRQAISAEMGQEFRAQAAQVQTAARLDAMQGQPVNTNALAATLRNAGYNEDYIAAESGRLNAMKDSAVQKNDDLEMAGTGSRVLNNPAPISSGAQVPLSVRNNNPGNLRDQSTGQFRVFDTPEAGAAAMQADLTAKISGNSPAMERNFGKGYSPTLSNVITTYAPAADKNDPKAYTDSVSKEIGFAPNQVLTVADIPKLQAAMTKVEAGGSNGRANPQSLMANADGSPQDQYSIARNLTALTPLSDDAVTLDKTTGQAHDVMQNALSIKAGMLSPQGDPASYLMTHNAPLNDLQVQSLKKPDNLPYYIKTVDNMYDSLNQPLSNRPILAKDVAQKLVQNITQGGAASGLKNLETMQQQYGQSFGRVFDDLVRNGLPKPYQVMMNIDNPMMRQQLARSYATDEKTLELSLGSRKNKIDNVETNVATIDNKIDTDSTLSTYLSTLENSGASPKDIAEYRTVLKRLSYQGTLEGKDAEASAADAIKSLAGQYSFYEKARIPAPIAGAVQNTAEATRNNLTADQVQIPWYAESPDNYIHSVRHGSEFVTNRDETGLILRDQSGFAVMGKNGKPITVPFQMQEPYGPPAPMQSPPSEGV